jgi:hypothetical protein
MLKCLVITPAFPPTVNGVQDFANILASALSMETPAEFCVLPLSSSSEKTILRVVNSFSMVHLHYVGYGYSKRGIPGNLVRALEKWKQNKRNQLLVTFHELFAASNIPWKSSFYLQKYQKFLFLRLSKIADYSLTSGHVFEPYFTSPVFKLPVFSNIPPPTFVIPFEMRNDYAVLWGNLEVKRKAYSLLEKYYSHITQHWKWTKIIDIGVVDPSPPTLPVPVIHLGFLSAIEISCILASSKYGILTIYSPDYFCKSGVFAAFASHGLAVLAGTSKDDYFACLDGLFSDFHFQKMDEDVYESAAFLASNVRKWYADHDILAHANLIYLPIIRHFARNHFRY